MTTILLVLVKISTVALILSVGMGATFSDILYLWRRPGLLLRSLLAMYVLVPLAAFVIVTFWPLAPGVEAALLVLAVSAGAPLLPRKLERFGSSQYAFSLVVVTSLLAIVAPGISVSRRRFRRSASRARSARASSYLWPPGWRRTPWRRR